MQAAGCALLHIHELPHRGVLEPRELFEGNKEFVVSGRQPDSVLGDVEDFNFGNTFALGVEFHLTAPV
jgi:hypothetical protein